VQNYHDLHRSAQHFTLSNVGRIDRTFDMDVFIGVYC
jgi:hypothetical protein